MTPEQLRIKITNGKAVSIFDNLQHAVKQGAIGAQYANGEVVIYPPNPPDKDSLEPMIGTYVQLLKDKGVPVEDAKRSAQGIKDGFYSGTAMIQSEIFSRLRNIIGSTNHNTHNNK